MWRRILAAVLLAVLTQTQMEAATGSTQSQPAEQTPLLAPTIPAEQSTKAEALSVAEPAQDLSKSQDAPVVSSYTRFPKLPRGREEEIVVLLCKPSGHFHGCWLTPEKQAGLVPLSLEVKPLDGFGIRYRQGDEYRSQPQGAPVRTGIGATVFRLKIRADRKVPLGSHQLEGKLTFQTVQRSGISEPQQIDVVIPLDVVEHDARVYKAGWSLEKPKEHDWGTTILLVLTAPFWVPAFLIFVAACSLQNDCE
jgi:hypothetical protein